jgi:NAD(P)-dependent dehydrogenase (short-subunit alcohol dehydrogenase family)
VRARILTADLTDEAEVSGLMARAAEALGGPLTLLINNASTFEHDDVRTATRQSWDQHLEANLRAPFVLLQEFAKGCKSCLSKPVCLLRFAPGCGVLRPRWCQSGVNYCRFSRP